MTGVLIDASAKRWRSETKIRELRRYAAYKIKLSIVYTIMLLRFATYLFIWAAVVFGPALAFVLLLVMWQSPWAAAVVLPVGVVAAASLIWVDDVQPLKKNCYEESGTEDRRLLEADAAAGETN